MVGGRPGERRLPCLQEGQRHPTHATVTTALGDIQSTADNGQLAAVRMNQLPGAWLLTGVDQGVARQVVVGADQVAGDGELTRLAPQVLGVGHVTLGVLVNGLPAPVAGFRRLDMKGRPAKARSAVGIPPSHGKLQALKNPPKRVCVIGVASGRTQKHGQGATML
ncbi:hypothetical protein D9M68_745130 [compost metagenome]